MIAIIHSAIGEVSSSAERPGRISPLARRRLIQRQLSEKNSVRNAVMSVSSSPGFGGGSDVAQK